MQSHLLELERVFKASLYGLAMFAGVILGLAENSWLPYGTVFLAAIGYWATESPGRFALGYFWSNLAGFLAVGLAGFEFFGSNPEGRLLAGTHLVVYATWIVFLQQSTIRKYWSLCALSVLQVAVAAVLTNDSWYGGALVAFAFAAMWTLSVFSLYHAVEQQPAPAKTEPSAHAPFRFEQAVSEAGHAIQFDGVARWITPRFVSGIGMLAGLAMLMSAAFYVLTPRVWIGQRFSFGETIEEPELGRRNLTGFTQQVKLGDLGQILESLEPVMTIQAYDVRSGEDRHLAPADLAQTLDYEEPLFRGGIMTTYDDGEWEADNFVDIPEGMARTPVHPEIRQEIVLEPVAGEILFCFGTPVACEIGGDRPRSSFNRLSGVLRQRRAFQDLRAKVSYRVYTTVPQPYEDGIPRVELRSSMPRSPRVRDQELERYLRRCRELPEKSLPRLMELSRTLAQEEADRLGRRPTVAELGSRLERYLRDSGLYSYTVSLTIQDPAIDPVEDFLFNRKTGHCEYFATALALMLRSVDIPSRLMNGFKGGETNYLGQIEVQQRHAHAWVEAWEGNGRWLVLDPTPAGARAQSVQNVAQGLSVWQQLYTSMGSIWSDWVMNFTPERQRDGLYLPLTEFGQKLLAQGEEVLTRGPMSLVGLLRFLADPREWFSLQGLWLFGALAVAAYAARRGYRRLRDWWRIVRDRSGGKLSVRVSVPFYERFVDLMKARGFQRPSTQTPAEFARTVAARLDGRSQTAEISASPGVITDLFYRVRYGETTLNDAETAAVNAALERLKPATTRPA